MVPASRGPQTLTEIEALQEPEKITELTAESVYTYGEPVKETRQQRRARDRNEKELSAYLKQLLDAFFSFAGKNFDAGAQQQELDRLNTIWVNWLRQNRKKYKYQVCAPVFGDEVKRLVALYAQAAHEADKKLAEQSKTGEAK